MKTTTSNVYSWEDAFSKYSSIVYRIALRVLKDSDAANDIVQESFLKYGMNLSEIENSEAWLKRVARNLSISKVRERNSRSHSHDFLCFLSACDRQTVEDNDFADKVKIKLGRLDSKYRNSIIECANGLTLLQSSQLNGIPPGTAGSRLAMGRSIMKEAFKYV